MDPPQEHDTLEQQAPIAADDHKESPSRRLTLMYPNVSRYYSSSSTTAVPTQLMRDQIQCIVRMDKHLSSMPNQSGTWVYVNDQELSQSATKIVRTLGLYEEFGKCILIRRVKLTKEGLPELSKDEISRRIRERDVVGFDLEETWLNKKKGVIYKVKLPMCEVCKLLGHSALQFQLSNSTNRT